MKFTHTLRELEEIRDLRDLDGDETHLWPGLQRLQPLANVIGRRVGQTLTIDGRVHGDRAQFRARMGDQGSTAYDTTWRTVGSLEDHLLYTVAVLNTALHKRDQLKE